MPVAVPTISSNGEQLDPSVGIVSLSVRRELNRIPGARLTLLDGCVARREFELSGSPRFRLGQSVQIALRYEGDGEDTQLFDGLVVRQSVMVQAEGSVLEVELKDAAYKLTRIRRSATYRDQTDDAIVQQLVTDAGLTAGEMESTALEHEELIQYHCSDWDFMVTRAESQGAVIDVDQGTVSMRRLQLSDTPDLELEYGMSEIREMELDMDGGDQLAEVSSTGWDVVEQALTAPEAADDPGVTAGDLDPAEVARQLGGESYTLLHAASLTPEELKAWADGRLLRQRFALLRGRLVIAGDPTLAPLATLGLSGISDRFNGNALVSAVTHRLGEGGWQTELELGLSPELFTRRPDLAEVAAAGLLPSVRNLQIATVAAYEEDPSGEHRIKVKLPALDDEQGFVWARVARPDAGAGRGIVFWPEPGDEVVLGFLGGDPRQAIVLGSLHGSTNSPPEVAPAPSEDNHVRAVVSRGGAVISFDDDKNVIRIETPAANTVVVDDDEQAITLADQHGNEIKMSADGIVLKSAADFTIDASGAVTIKGSSVDVQ